MYYALQSILFVYLLHCNFRFESFNVLLLAKTQLKDETLFREPGIDT